MTDDRQDELPCTLRGHGTATAEQGKGGDVSFQHRNNFSFAPGKGNPEGSFFFNLPDGTEYLRIEPDGRAFVRGNLVATDRLVYMAFRDWLRQARVRLDDGQGGEPATLTPNKEG